VDDQVGAEPDRLLQVGVVKQLSTTRSTPRSRQSGAERSRSMSWSPGFDGVSTKTSFVSGRIAASHASAGASAST
jgi:hypothetical protein